MRGSTAGHGGRRFNERTGTPFNDLQYPTDLVLLAVLRRRRYKLSVRDVAELLLQRGCAVTNETIRDWEFRFAPLLANRLRAKRRGRAGVSWYIDESYLKVAERKPLRITTDTHPAYRKAIRWIVGRKVRYRCDQYLNNPVEQDHRAVKQCDSPMRGFGRSVSAAQFCAAFDEVSQYLRVAAPARSADLVGDAAPAIRGPLAVPDPGDAGRRGHE